jgi:hypothetical protein
MRVCAVQVVKIVRWLKTPNDVNLTTEDFEVAEILGLVRADRGYYPVIYYPKFTPVEVPQKTS